LHTVCVLRNRSAEGAKLVPAIYAAEYAAASSNKSTPENFPAFKPDRNLVQKWQKPKPKSIPFFINKVEEGIVKTYGHDG
ncbi:hypothetical protein T4B_7909, partial [Trichinella pseudospiralis]